MYVITAVPSYANDAPRCPYCGGDNFEKSVQVHEDTRSMTQREAARWEEKPQRDGESKDVCNCLKVLITVIVAGLLIQCRYICDHAYSYGCFRITESGGTRKAGEDVSAAGLQRNLYAHMKKHDIVWSETFRKYRLVETH